MKVISWCFYDNPKYIKRWPEYLAGLKMNTTSVKKLFNGWRIRLYVRISSKQIYDSVSQFAAENNIELFHVEENQNPMIERYMPLLEMDVDVCIIRDLDSILSEIDSKYIEEWLASPSLVLCYREYTQEQISMGGGIAVKVSKSELWKFQKTFASIDPSDRGYDEDVLDKLICNIHATNVKTILTRCTLNGSYYIYSPGEYPKTDMLLWTVPFPVMPYGTLIDTPSVDCMVNLLSCELTPEIYHTSWV